ncbi:hypothetical protein E4T44_08788 [Aureobasidium sp. EXF-8845]|nr:hypothetical protein E4T44_08788 [Aureobasidium sp. EXF-8845]KAI4849593.1 hypothetical protein E4T45_05853 [Aureobasidium sp. EXF-8846]
MSPAEAHAHYNVSSDYSPIPEDALIDVVEGSESDYDHELGRKTESKNRKKHAAPIQTTFHCWTLTKAVPKSRDDAPNWKRAERVQMTLSSDELGSQVKKQLKARSLTEMYEALSTDQRQQVEVLLKEKRLDETNRYASWEIAAIHREVRNNMKTRIRETTFIRAILSREDKRKPETTVPEPRATKAGASSNISDLNDLSDLLLRPVETNEDQYFHARTQGSKVRPKVRRDPSEDVVEIVSIPNSESRFAVNVPSVVNPSPSNQVQHYPALINQGPFWQPSSANYGHDYIAQHRLNQWQPQQALSAQEAQQLNHVHNALAHMANGNHNASPPTASWFPHPPPSIQRPLEHNLRDKSTQQHLGGVASHVASPHYEPRPTNSERDYFERRVEKPYEAVGEPFFAEQPQHAHESTANKVSSHHPENLQALRTPPSAKINDSDWPDYDPTTEQPSLPTPQAQQHRTHEKQSVERSRREDVLFWRTQAQLSHSRSASSLDDQSSTLASPEQSSPLTSVSGDGVGPSRRWTNEPEPRYDDRDEHLPGRFGQQLAAHNFLRPKQDKTPMIPRSKQSDYRPPTGRGVSFQDELFARPAPHTRNSHNPSMYTPDAYARPSAPDPPEPKASFSAYHPQRYQPRQNIELKDTSLLERLSERLDNMELRQAESATRKAVEAAQKRRELERKEAYERGIEDAMAWKARSGGFGSFE